MKKKILFSALVLSAVVFCSCDLVRKGNAGLARFNNDLDQEWKIQDSNKRIANYEWFYDQYGTIKSTAQKAKLATGDEKTAVTMVLADMVETYNSHSLQTMTRALWKASDLPYQLDVQELLEDK